jgi:hypothetical protein
MSTSPDFFSLPAWQVLTRNLAITLLKMIDCSSKLVILGRPTKLSRRGTRHVGGTDYVMRVPGHGGGAATPGSARSS